MGFLWPRQEELPAVGLNQSTGHSEVEFEQMLEKHLNEKVVLGPGGFRLLEDSSQHPINEAILDALNLVEGSENTIQSYV